MANNLQLITTETFGDLSCNFYRNMNDDILLTREQIGTALEYSNPQKAIQKIHLSHRDRLESLCVRIIENRNPQNGGVGVNVETVYYTQRGVMEICRFSKQAKANQFMDWVWDIVEKYRNREFATHKGISDLKLESLSEKLNTIEQNQKKILSNLNQSGIRSKWLSDTLSNLGFLQSFMSFLDSKNLLPYDFTPAQGNITFSWAIHIVITQAESINSNIIFSEYKRKYENEMGCICKRVLDFVEYYQETKELFTESLNIMINTFKSVVKEEIENNINIKK